MAITQLGYHETLINDYVDALNGSLTDSATTITVDSTTGLPAIGFFRLKIDNELILCDGAPTSTTISVAASGRGIEGTTAVSHADNATVSAVLTGEGFQRFMLDHRATGFTETEPIRSMAINRFLNDNNDVLTVSDFFWVNQGSATATDLNGAIYMTVPDEVNPNLRLLVLQAPMPPYRVLCKVNFGVGMGNLDNTGTQAGIFFRESQTGKVITATARYGGRLAFLRFTNPTTFDQVIDTNQQFHEDAIWLRLDDDGTDLAMRSSTTGIGFSRTEDAAWWTQGRTAHMANGPNQIGIYINSGTNSGSTGAGPCVCHATFECFRVERL